MFGQLCDFFYIEKLVDSNGNINGTKYIYYEHVPISYLFSSKNNKILIPNTYIYIITLEYGDTKPDIVDFINKLSNIGSENLSLFLHPIIRIFNNFNNKFIYNLNSPYFISLPNNYLNIEELVDIHHFDENIIAEFTSKKIYFDKFIRLIKSYY
jgi:hypothetical protein